MSSSIPIPPRKIKYSEGETGHRRQSGRHGSSSSSSSPSPAMTPSSAASSSSSSSSFGYGRFTGTNATAATPSQSPSYRDRRPSLMSRAFTQAEHTVVNVGNAECPRLISCVKASQGFCWNQEIFLPSYVDYHHEDIECRQDPVLDIFVTDEEVRGMFPS